MKNSGLGISKHRVLSWKENVVLTLILTAGAFLTGAFGAYWFELSSIPHHFPGVWHAIDIILFILLTYVVWHQIVNEMFSWFLSLDMAKPKRLEPEANLRVAFLTAFVPGKEPYEVLENTLGAMIRCDYPHDTWLLDEGDDAMAKVICRKYGVKYFTRKNRPEYNLDRGPYMAKTKGGNYNAWYTEHSSMYDFVAQLDVDFEPKRDFLTKTLGYFRDPKIAFVGTPQIYGNQDKSWIARAAAEQAFSFYGIIQRGLFAKDMPLFIGANHVVRVTAHDDIGGYSGHIVEDHLTGMNFYANKWRSVYLPEVLAVGEGPATWDSYFSQQMRWAYGLIHILFTQSPKVFRRMRPIHAFNYYFLQQYYFDGIAQGIGVLLLTLYFLFGIQSASMALMPLFYLYLPLLLTQLGISIWLQRVNIDPNKESGLLLNGKFLSLAAWPIYLLAFIGVLRGKKLIYRVTPKGTSQVNKVQLSLFYPHIVLGSITGIGLVVAYLFHHLAGQLVFWGVLNTVGMYSIVLTAFYKPVGEAIKHMFNSVNYIKFLGFNFNPVVPLDKSNSM